MRGIKDIIRTKPTESTKQGSSGITETKRAITEPAWGCTRFSVFMMWLFSLWFYLKHFCVAINKSAFVRLFEIQSEEAGSPCCQRGCNSSLSDPLFDRLLRLGTPTRSRLRNDALAQTALCLAVHALMDT